MVFEIAYSRVKKVSPFSINKSQIVYKSEFVFHDWKSFEALRLLTVCCSYGFSLEIIDIPVRRR